MKKHACLALGLTLMVGTAFADDKELASKMVNEAVAAMLKDKAATVAEIGNPQGRFVKGEVYVFAYDLKGTMVAHPINAKLVGKNLLDVPDAEGKMFRKEIIEGVNSTGVVRVAYKYKNPQNGAIENKISLCKKAVDLAICSGYYQ